MTDDPKIDIVFMAVPGLEPQPLDPQPNTEQGICPHHHTLTEKPVISMDKFKWAIISKQ